MQMKINVEVDCTPTEARQFFGLPNVEPMQTAVLAQLEKKMLSEIDNFSPETVMKSWLAMIPANAEMMQELFARTFGTGKK
jgi:hypothetical protein